MTVDKGEIHKELPEPILIEDLGRIFPTENSKSKYRFGLYKCGFCGTEFKANTNNVVQGKTRSCGCYHKRRVSETQKTHGLKNTRLYTVWAEIKNRTLNPKNKNYKYYGGRGIIICDEWKNDVKSFYDWAITNGYEEDKGLSIDRINNEGNYEPNNCRWTTRVVQNRNQRIKKNNTSGYRGVSFKKSNNKHTARICVDKNRVFLGYFSTAEDGAIAYNNYIIENNLEGFILNEIPEEYKNDKNLSKK